MDTLGMTHSACETCRRLVPAKVVAADDRVYLRKFCPDHGEVERLVWHGTDSYLHAQRYVKPAWRPDAFSGDDTAACPDGCGMCSRHEQHLCMPIVEITSRCDLTCPVCIADAGAAWDMSPGEFSNLLDNILAAERQVDVLNLSGGEPLLHPDLVTFVDDALARPGIVRVSVSTNGLRFLDRPGLLDALCERDVVISLQLDGFGGGDLVLRGRLLADEKRRVLDMLEERSATMSLTMTVAAGVNDNEYRGLLDYLFANDHVVSLMVQPLAFAGRARECREGIPRLTIPDVVAGLAAAGHPAVRAEDFVPLPCSHPLCFSLAFYLVTDGGGSVALNQLTGADALMDTLANRVVFGLDEQEHEILKDRIYELWSGPTGTAPNTQAVLKTLRAILAEMSCGCFDPRKAFTVAERRVKSIFIHAFQDAETFDLARVRRCCQAYGMPDGTLVPACVHNVMRRGR